jgi:endonuclease-3
MYKKTAVRIYRLLEREYPRAKCALVHKNPLQLLVSTILSAQCTDARVNEVTKDLFRKYRNADDYASASRDTFEREIRSTGFYRNKAKNIISAAGLIAEKHYGRVPDNMEELIELPGVARKTANIVLYNAYGKNSGVAVDTHVKRVSHRLGLTGHKDPVKIEKDLMSLYHREKWGQLSHLLIAHGRNICRARKAICSDCVLAGLCPSAGKV